MKSQLLMSNAMLDDVAVQDETFNTGAVEMALQRAAQPFMDAAVSPGTRRVYEAAWRQWCVWCRWMHAAPAPANPRALAAYLAELANAGRSVSTLETTLSAIQFGNRARGHALDRKSSLIANVLAGIKRTTSRKVNGATPLEIAQVREIVASIAGTDLRALRDRALILVAYFAAMRRSELVSLEISGRSYVEVQGQGLLIHISGTKSCAGTQTIAVSRRADDLCPCKALVEYLTGSGIAGGPLFRAISKSGRLLHKRLDATSVRHILRVRVERCYGASGQHYSPHSLRSGFATSAAKAGVPEHLIQRTTRHRSADVLRRYIRQADAFASAPDQWL